MTLNQYHLKQQITLLFSIYTTIPDAKVKMHYAYPRKETAKEGVDIPHIQTFPFI